MQTNLKNPDTNEGSLKMGRRLRISSGLAQQQTWSTEMISATKMPDKTRMVLNEDEEALLALKMRH